MSTHGTRTATRRGLLGGAAALAVAPAAAMAGGLHQAVLPPSHPDADLIQVCAEFDACERAYGVIHGTGPGAIEDDDEAGVASAPILDRQRALLDRMDELRAATPAGIQARAHSLAAHAGHGAYSFNAADTAPGRLLAYLLRDAAALGGAGAEGKLGTPDAGLLAACAAFDKLETAYIMSFNGELDDTPEYIAAVEERDRIHEAQAPLVDRICSQPATTLAGMQAKARSLVLWDEDAIEDGAKWINDRLRTSLLRDLVDHAGAVRAAA